MKTVFSVVVFSGLLGISLSAQQPAPFAAVEPGPPFAVVEAQAPRAQDARAREEAEKARQQLAAFQDRAKKEEEARRPQPAPGSVRSQNDEPRQLVNIKVEVTVSEDGGGDPPNKKTVVLLMADRENASVRSTGAATPPPRLNVDAFAMMQRDGRALVQLTLESGIAGRATTVRVQPLLESGKALVVSEAVDPVTGRRTSVQLLATIMK